MTKTTPKPLPKGPPRREYGLMYKDQVIPGTERIIRFPDVAWYYPNDDDVKPRKPVSRPDAIIDLATWHWTAGHTHMEAEGAIKVFTSMQARKKKTGEDMKVAVTFVLTQGGHIVQFADMSLVCFHAHRHFSDRGVGIEWTSPGTKKQAIKLGELDKHKYESRRLLGGRAVLVVTPSDEAKESALWLGETLARVAGLPRVVNPLLTAFNNREVAKAEGVVEHFKAPGTDKIDCMGLFLDVFEQAGWAKK